MRRRRVSASASSAAAVRAPAGGSGTDAQPAVQRSPSSAPSASIGLSSVPPNSAKRADENLVLEDLPDLSGHQVYACGAPVVVDSARKEYIEQAGLPAEEFFADSFTTEADKA